MKLSLKQKQWVIVALLVVGLALMLVYQRVGTLWVGIVGAVIAVSAFPFSLTQMRCPHCGKRLKRGYDGCCGFCGKEIDMGAKPNMGD